MKKFLFLIGGFISSLTINAQSISFSDAAVLFSSEENNGTARFSAMSGAFGALGGDMSAGDINPAGLAIFKNAQATVTFGLRNTDINTSFHGTGVNNNNDYLNLTQAGGVMVFNNKQSPYWSKIALGVNYTLAKDFENSYNVNGNSGISEFNNDPYLNNDNNPDNDIFYNNVDGQFFGNFMNGQNEKFTFSLAAQYSEQLYLGFSIVTHSLDYVQSALFEESNNDGNDNLLDASLLHDLHTYGDGIGFTMGFIAKPSQFVRLGVSYQTPTWYNLTDEFVEDLEISVSNNPDLYQENSGVSVFDYNLTTPGRLTGSFAYILGKDGLLSFDYTYKNYPNIKLKPTTEFVDENNIFVDGLKNTSTFKIGTEWRFDNLSLRGGYVYEESPFKDAIDSDNMNGYSLGVGFKFNGRIKLDLAYQNTTNTDVYRFLNLEGVQPAELDITNDKFTATLAIGL